MQAVKWVVAKLQGDKKQKKKLLLAAGKWVVAKLRVTKQHPNLPWNFMTPGFLDPSGVCFVLLFLLLLNQAQSVAFCYGCSFDYLYRFSASFVKASMSERSPWRFLISVPNLTARVEFTLHINFSTGGSLG